MFLTLATLLQEGGEAVSEEVSHAAEGNGYWLLHSTGEMVLGTISFLIVVALLIKFAGPSIKKANAARTERIAAELSSGKEKVAEAEQAAAQIRAALADRDDKIAEINAEAAATAETLRAELMAKAEADAESIRTRGLADVEATKRQALADLSNEISRRSMTTAERLIGESLNDATQQDLIERYIADVARSGS